MFALLPAGPAETSTSTGARSARARSLGANEATKGTLIPTQPAPPAIEAAASQRRRSTSLHANLEDGGIPRVAGLQRFSSRGQDFA